MGVVCKLLKTVLVSRGFAGFAKPNLIGGDDTKTVFLQNLVGRLPSGRTKVFSMQQNGDMTIGLGGQYVQVSHVYIALLRAKRISVNSGWVVKAF